MQFEREFDHPLFGLVLQLGGDVRQEAVFDVLTGGVYRTLARDAVVVVQGILPGLGRAGTDGVRQIGGIEVGVAVYPIEHVFRVL